MKPRLLSLLLLVSGPLFAQDFLDEIAKAGCKCIEGKEFSTDAEQRNMELGLCLIEAAADYKAELLDQYEIDFNKIDEHGEQLGQLIGVRMVGICPELLTSFIGGGEESVEADLVETGVITKVEKDMFIAFTLKNDDGKSTRFFWLTFIKSEADLPTMYESLKKKKVEISYFSEELFDPRILEYRNFNIITGIKLL